MSIDKEDEPVRAVRARGQAIATQRSGPPGRPDTSRTYLDIGVRGRICMYA